MSYSSASSVYSSHNTRRPQPAPSYHFKQPYLQQHHLPTPQPSLSPNSSMFHSPASAPEHNFLMDQSPSFGSPAFPEDLELSELDNTPFRNADSSGPWNPLYVQAATQANVSLNTLYQAQPYYNGLSNTPSQSQYVASEYGDAYETPMTSQPPQSEICWSDHETQFPALPDDHGVDYRQTHISVSETGSISTNGGSRKRAATDHPLKCETCSQELRTESEFKKHKAKHEKSHTCPVPGCSHGNEHAGFTTSNDLERHMGSKHDIFLPGTKLHVYQCKARGCEGKKKLWPRFDNFKQHIERMHRAADMDKIINESKRPPNFTDASYHYEAILRKRDEKNITQLHQAPGQYHVPNYSQQPVRVQHSQSMPSVQVSKGSSLPTTSLTEQRPAPMASISSPCGHLMAAAPRRKSDAALRNSSATPSARRHSRTSTQGCSSSKPTLHQVNTDLSLDTPRITVSPSDMGLAPSDASSMLHTEISGANVSREQAIAIVKRLASRESSGAIATILAKELGVDQDLAMTDCAPEKTESPEGPRGRFECTDRDCTKSFLRECDLNKHLKRHAKPFGCTFDGCRKQFGSKNDWKRHEHSQHYQNECWRCPLKRTDSRTGDTTCNKIPATDQCARIYHKEEDFKSHLQHDHQREHAKHKGGMDEWLSQLSTASRIGANGQKSFWCGFCKEIQQLQSQELRAWDERFNHIGGHFNEGQHIDTWFVCNEKRCTKGSEKECGKTADVDSPDMEPDTPEEYYSAVEANISTATEQVYCASCNDGPQLWSGLCQNCGSHERPVEGA